MSLNLIRVFDFYLALMLVVGFYRRRGVYRDVFLILFGFAFKRWPLLLNRLNQHKREVVNWQTVRPLLIALVLMAAQMVASHVLIPQATVTLNGLLEHVWPFVIVVATAVPMLAVDLYFILRVGRFDHAETVAYFDKAETWAGWRAEAVRLATFGRVNPNRMVDDQVKDGLRQLGSTLSWAMWWVSAQVILRLCFGLVLWAMWWVGHGG